MSFFFFFNDTATTEIYTLSLHDALPILRNPGWLAVYGRAIGEDAQTLPVIEANEKVAVDRKSTRLNSSHQIISYAVFCLKKKKTPETRYVLLREERLCSRASTADTRALA